MNVVKFLRDFVDHASPKLDTYEQAIYLLLVRRTYLEGLTETVLPVQSAAGRTALGIAKKGARISRDVYRKKLQSLERKGFVRIAGTEYRGTRIRVLLPSDVPGIVPDIPPKSHIDLETLDFFAVPKLRDSIFAREGGTCFYCRTCLNDNNRVIDHLVSRPKGDNSYRNCVAACLQCNSEKGSGAAGDFLRALYRKGRLSANELDARLEALSRIQEARKSHTSCLMQNLLAEPFAEARLDFFLREGPFHASVLQPTSHLVEHVEVVLNTFDRSMVGKPLQ
jgi:HNH endonuclease